MLDDYEELPMPDLEDDADFEEEHDGLGIAVPVSGATFGSEYPDILRLKDTLANNSTTTTTTTSGNGVWGSLTTLLSSVLGSPTLQKAVANTGSEKADELNNKAALTALKTNLQLEQRKGSTLGNVLQVAAFGGLAYLGFRYLRRKRIV